MFPSVRNVSFISRTTLLIFMKFGTECLRSNFLSEFNFGSYRFNITPNLIESEIKFH